MAGWSLGGAIRGAVVGFLQTGTPFGAAAGFVIGGTVVGDAERHARNIARGAYNAAQRDRDIMVQSATEPMRIVYGRAKVSGPIAYAQTTGSKSEFLHMVVCLAGHECDAIETVYLNEIALTLNGSGQATNEEFIVRNYAQSVATVSRGVAVTLPHVPRAIISCSATLSGAESDGLVSYTWTPGSAVITVESGIGTARVQYEYETASTYLVKVRKYLGTSTQSADADLVSASGGKWTSAHRLRGITYLALTLEFTQDAFGSTGRPNVSAVVRGWKIADPRTGTTVWTQNAALCTAHYLTHYMGAPALPTAELTAEANTCDELVTLTVGGATQARYTVNGALDMDGAPRDHLNSLCQAMAGTVAWVQGRYLLRVGRHRASTLSITADHLADAPVRIRPATSRADLINRVKATYWEPSKAYTQVEAPAVTNALYVAQDGGIELLSDVTLDMVDDVMRAQRLCKIRLERARQGLTAEVTCKLSAYDVAPGDVVDLTLDRYGWAGKLFVVADRSIDLAAGTVALSLRETASAVWDWAYGEATTVDLTPNTSLTSAFARPAALTGLAVASGTPYLLQLADGTLQCRARVSWTQAPDVNVQQGGKVRVRWCTVTTAGASEWIESTPVDGADTFAMIGPLVEGVPITVGVLPVTQLGKTAPVWSYAAHIPAGKSAPPSDVAGVTVRVVPGALVIGWDAPADIDYAETEIRVGASWAAGTLLFVGRQTEWAWPWPEVGAYTLWLKHRDTSGNVSAASATLTVTITSSNAQIGQDVQWTDGAGNLVTWDTGTGADAVWGSLTDVTYLVDTVQLADGAATGDKIADGAVGTLKMEPNAATIVYTAFDPGPNSFNPAV